MSTASDDDLGAMVEDTSDTEESTSRTDHDETSHGGDEESTYVGGGDLLREILRDLSVSFDTTKSGSNSNSQASGGTHSKESSGNGDTSEQEESSSTSTLSNDEYDEIEISEEERLRIEKELVEGLLENAMRTGKEPDVIRPPQFKEKKVAFAKKKTVRSTELVVVEPEATPEAAADKKEEPAAKEESVVDTTVTTTIVSTTTAPTKASSSSYLPSILNLWSCADEKNVEEELQERQTSRELLPALASLESRSSDMAPSDEEKVDKTMMLQSSGSMQSAADAATAAAAVHKKEAEKHIVHTALRELDTAHKEQTRSGRSRGGGLSKTHSMPVDFHNEEMESAIRAVRSHEVMPRQFSVEEGTKSVEAVGDEELPQNEDAGDVAAENTVDDIAVKEEDAGIVKAEDVEKNEDRESGKFRRFSGSASNHMIDTVRSSTSWVKPVKSSENLRQVKSLDYEMNRNSILLPQNQDFVVCGLAAQYEDGEDVMANLSEEVDQLNKEKGDATDQTEVCALTSKESRAAPKFTMGRLKMKIKGLAKGKSLKEPSFFNFSAGQQQVKQRKPRRNKHNIFRSLAKYVKSQPLALAVIEENPELETRAAREEPVPPVLHAQDEETLMQASSKVKNTELHEGDATSMTDTVAVIAVTMSQSMAEQRSEARSHLSEPSVDDDELRNPALQGESKTKSEDESETSTDTDTNSSDDWASTDEGHTFSTSNASNGAREANDDGAEYTNSAIGDELEAEMGTEITLMPKGYSTDIELVDSRGDLCKFVDIDAFNETFSEEIHEQLGHEKEDQSSRNSQERKGNRNGKKGPFRIKELLSDFKKKTTGKSGAAAAAGVAANASIQISKETASVVSPVEISQPALSVESTTEVDPGGLQMRSWIESEHQKGNRFTSLMASPSSPRSFKAGRDCSIEKQKTWTGMSPELSLLLATEGKSRSTARKSFEAPPTHRSPRGAATTEEVRDDTTGISRPSSRQESARDEERTGPATELETDKTSPHGRQFFSGMLSKSSLMTKAKYDELVPECLEHTLTSYDQGGLQSSPASLPDVPTESLRTVIDLQRWKSVEQKIDASLKKAEALASHYGGDLSDIIPASVSYSSYASSSVGLSAATSNASEMVSVAESKPDDWRKVGRKIDDSISKVEQLAFRLGFDEKRGKLLSE